MFKGIKSISPAFLAAMLTTTLPNPDNTYIKYARYLEYIGKIGDIVTNSDTDEIIIFGDCMQQSWNEFLAHLEVLIKQFFFFDILNFRNLFKLWNANPLSGELKP